MSTNLLACNTPDTPQDGGCVSRNLPAPSTGPNPEEMLNEHVSVRRREEREEGGSLDAEPDFWVQTHLSTQRCQGKSQVEPEL